MCESMLTNLSLLFSAYLFQFVCVSVSVCVFVCYGGREGSGVTLMVIAEGGDPELELSKDQRKLLSVPKEFYCSSDSEDYSGFLVVVSMTLDPTSKDSGFFHPVW